MSGYPPLRRKLLLRRVVIPHKRQQLEQLHRPGSMHVRAYSGHQTIGSSGEKHRIGRRKNTQKNIYRCRFCDSCSHPRHSIRPTEHKLTQVSPIVHNTPEFIYNPPMSVEVIFSDTHLGPYKERRDRPRLNYLLSLIDSADRVIINGDFWDGWWTSFADFSNSGWSQLFRPLRGKNAVYIRGNHDPDVPKYPKLFWDTTIKNAFTFQRNGSVYTILHGDSLDTWRHMDRLMERRIVQALYPIGRWLQEHTLTSRFSKKIYETYRAWNTEQKNQLMRHYGPHVWKITGHTHLAELDPSMRYINAGVVDTHLLRSSHVEINDNGPRLIRQFTPFEFEQ